MSSLPHVFSEVCAKRPDRVAVTAAGRELTYAELDAASDRLASSLVARGVRRGDLVGLKTGRTVETPAAILGILKAGAAYVPLDPAYPEDRLRMMIEDAGLEIVVDSIPSDGEETVDVSIGPDDPAYVIYTSGSTGRPKGCVVTHGNVLALLEAALPLFDVGADDRWTLFHSVSFDFSVWELWGALATGATAVMVPDDAARSPADFLDLLAAERVTVLNQVPSVFRYLARAHEAAGRPPLALRYVVFGGEGVDLDVVASFAPGRRPAMVNMYGITETTVHVTYKSLGAEEAVASPIGRPLPHLAVSLRDGDGKPVPPGAPGEMWISGAGVAAGYLNRPELTAERFVTVDGRRHYRSGDLARLLPDGELEYLGRADRQLKLRGFRIEPGEIEAVLRAHDGVQDAAVTVTTTRAGAQFLEARIVPAVPDGLRAHAAAALPAHMVPDRYRAVPELPRTPSGKLDRTAL